ncbi:hypothetical protein OSJ57_18610 [Sphingomonas sp. HH69]
MSGGIDFAACGLATMASADRARTLAEFSASAMPGAVKKVDTTGHCAAGLGAASYVCDALSTPALATAHPLAALIRDDVVAGEDQSLAAAGG